jgi:hypothetical protein
VKIIPFSDQEAAGGIRAVRGIHTPEQYARTDWFRAYEPSVIPGPLQSVTYMHAMKDFWAGQLRPGIDEGERSESVLAAVRDHQDLAHIALGRTFHAVIEEAVLHNAVGGPDVLAGALQHLLELVSETPLLRLWVIPGWQGRDVTPQAPFWLLGRGLACGETGSFSWAEEGVPEVAAYERLYGSLQRMALHGSASRQLIVDALGIARHHAGLPVKFEG